MTRSLNEVDSMINVMDMKLEEQLENVFGVRSVEADVVRMMVPVMRDQLSLMREVLNFADNNKE